MELTNKILPYLAAASMGGMGVAIVNYFNTKSAPHGDEKTMEIADTIQSGALVFLKKEYSIIAVFVAIVTVSLAVFIPEVGKQTAVAYLLGAGFSMGAGWFGMQAATTASISSRLIFSRGSDLARAIISASGLTFDKTTNASKTTA
ncbi:MAG: hypothetical protein COB53_05500 [Elusimicrobia bacterium]|nr:MAG: hypothetical protein COB53_05500 [Elusimicrobiota bacterium]